MKSTFSGLKFDRLGTLASGNRCLCLSAEIGAVMRISFNAASGVPVTGKGSTFECGATGATVKKNGFPDWTPSSRRP
jgi:hypothetical protein